MSALARTPGSVRSCAASAGRSGTARSVTARSCRSDVSEGEYRAVLPGGAPACAQTAPDRPDPRPRQGTARRRHRPAAGGVRRVRRRLEVRVGDGVPRPRAGREARRAARARGAGLHGRHAAGGRLAPGVAAQMLAWAEGLGFPCVEVSSGVAPIAAAAKRELIETAAARFVVLAEIGSKDPSAEVSPTAWAA